MPNLLPTEEADLARRLKAHDQRALGSLYDAYGRLVYVAIFSIVRDTGMAEDLSQETFLKAWTHIATFDPARGGLRVWLVAMARNRAIDYVRSVDGRMAPRAVDLDAATPLLRSEGFERDLLRSDRVRAIRCAYHTLPPHHRIVLHLSFEMGLSHSEIAAKLERPLGTVKSWARAAIQSLRAQLAFE